MKKDESVKKKYLTLSFLCCIMCKVIEMDKLARQALLFDFYGELLTKHQRSIYEEVILDDYSLSEVAENHGISRQGVHDLVKRSTKILEDYEQKLHLVDKFVAIRNKIHEIYGLTQNYAGQDLDDQDLNHLLKEIGSLTNSILEEL